MKNEYILALDIGTRTVIGLLCRLTNLGEVSVEHYQVEWHPQRAMLDGQIHDVGQVSAVLIRIKEALEEMAGKTLEGAAIAAAGRALSTLRVTEQLEFAASREIEQQDIQQLEVKALVSAREAMAQKTSALYCVGFSPVCYFLDDSTIANPLGQRGRSIGIEIIATFLPRVVVDSLFSAVAKAGLTVESLTLEPIAAMAVAIPPELRLLNLALADIGAGTSDISISRGGTIVSYGMVDMAGDEVTEAIAQHYLLDFNSAEKVKIQLSKHEVIEFTDVLGNDCQESRESILAIIDPVVDKLARELSTVIKQNNGGVSPAALFCAGGGSLTPTLRERLARYLGLPLDRVGIRTREHVDGIRFSGEELRGPEIITPLGIAITALKPKGDNFIRIWINGQEVTLLQMQTATVAHALMHCGLDMEAVAGADYPLQFELNGSKREVRGHLGQAGKIKVNDLTAKLDTPLQPGDRVEVTPGGRGTGPMMTLASLAEEFSLPQLLINSSRKDIPLVQMINGLPCHPDTPIQQGDRVEIRPPKNLGELSTLMDIDLREVVITVDGAVADWNTLVDSDSVIAITRGKPALTLPQDENIVVTVNGQNVSLPLERSMLAYALAQADIKHSGEAKGNLVITINGNDAEYTTLLNTGDKVEVFWAPKV